MNTFFINPIKQKLYPIFKIKVMNFGNQNTRPALVINWSTGTQIVVKKTLLFENGDLLSDYVIELANDHPLAFNRLLSFSEANIKEKYASVHSIIASKLKELV